MPLGNRDPATDQESITVFHMNATSVDTYGVHATLEAHPAAYCHQARRPLSISSPGKGLLTFSVSICIVLLDMGKLDTSVSPLDDSEYESQRRITSCDVDARFVETSDVVVEDERA